MIKQVLFAAAALGALVSIPASAATLVSQQGSAATFAAPAGALTFNFNAPTSAFTLTNAAIVTGTTPLSCVTGCSAQPAFSDGSGYLAIYGGGVASYQGSAAFESVSFFLGSIDTFNSVRIFSTTGALIAAYTGADFTLPFEPNGDRSFPYFNRRVTYSVGSGEAKIGGISFSSGLNSAEVDNVVFAVPEPSTWLTMLAGFGMIGLAMRARRRRTNVVFA